MCKNDSEIQYRMPESNISSLRFYPEFSWNLKTLGPGTVFPTNKKKFRSQERKTILFFNIKNFLVSKSNGF
jgi:hypothetical protein